MLICVSSRNIADLHPGVQGLCEPDTAARNTTKCFHSSSFVFTHDWGSALKTTGSRFRIEFKTHYHYAVTLFNLPFDTSYNLKHAVMQLQKDATETLTSYYVVLVRMG